MNNTFQINESSHIEISDGFIRINNSVGNTDIRYEGNFALKQLSECLQIILEAPTANNGKCFSNWEHGMSIAIEFIDSDYCNIYLSCEYVYICINIKRDLLPSLTQFFASPIL